jgi:xanthine dehydrogenase accessory factor
MDHSTAIAVLTHDPKLDDPALQVALPSDAFYVGALGSRTTQEKRRKRLHENGLSQVQLERLRGPIGLDLGGHNPEEIALSIMAEILAVRKKTNSIQDG